MLHRRHRQKIYLVMDAAQALCHGKHRLVLFCMAHVYVASCTNECVSNKCTDRSFKQEPLVMSEFGQFSD